MCIFWRQNGMSFFPPRQGKELYSLPFSPQSNTDCSDRGGWIRAVIPIWHQNLYSQQHFIFSPRAWLQAFKSLSVVRWGGEKKRVLAIAILSVVVSQHLEGNWTVQGGFNHCVTVLQDNGGVFQTVFCRKGDLKPISDSELSGRLNPSAAEFARRCAGALQPLSQGGSLVGARLQPGFANHQVDLAIRAAPQAPSRAGPAPEPPLADGCCDPPGTERGGTGRHAWKSPGYPEVLSPHHLMETLCT